MNEIDNLQNELDRHLPPHAGHVSVPSSDAPNAELQPLLVVAERLAAAPQPRLSDTARARIEAQLRAASSAIAQPQPRTASIRRFNGLQAMRWAAACLAVVVLLSWGTVRASANSLPGEPLYPVKRLAENAQLAFSADDLDLHLTFAERRMTEFATLAERGEINLAVLADANQELAAALELAESSTELAQLTTLTTEQGELIAFAATHSKSSQVASLTTDYQQLEAGLAVHSPTPQPTALPSPTLTMTIALSITPTATLSPTVTASPTAIDVGDSGTCTRGAGYWFTHPAAWPNTSLSLGNQTYSQAELLALRGGISGDASITLARHLIAAKLNALASETSSAAIATADALLAAEGGRLPLAIDPNSPTGQAMLAAARQLRAYNASHTAIDCIVPTLTPTPAQSPDDDGGNDDNDNIDCKNPPPAHAPAEGWRKRCEGQNTIPTPPRGRPSGRGGNN